ncbi:hypothetical protein VPH35_125812 [Triticum aestivum]
MVPLRPAPCWDSRVPDLSLPQRLLLDPTYPPRSIGPLSGRQTSSRTSWSSWARSSSSSICCSRNNSRPWSSNHGFFFFFPEMR